MLSRFSLKYQFLALSAVTMLIAVGLGALSVYQSKLFNAAVASGARGIDAVRDSALTDMYHDGMRSVVLNALFIAETKPTEMPAVVKEGDEMAQNLRQAYGAVRSLGFDGNVATRLAAVDKPIQDYLAIAKDIIALAGKDRTAAIARLDEFNRYFEQLEAALAAATDALSAEVKDEQARNEAQSTMLSRVAIGSAGLSILLALLAYLVTRRSLVRPLTAMIEALLALSRGDLSKTVAIGKRGDEIGSLGQAIHVFRDGIASRQRLGEEQARIQDEANQRQAAAMQALADDFERSVGRLIDETVLACTNMQENARLLAGVLAEASSQTQAVASSADGASANVQSVAATGEELTGSIAEISRQVAQSSAMSAQAVQEAGSMDGRIKALTTAANQIGEVVSMISDIAGQTNLLALNATIEAARAGEAGKGFAVVASEVKALASQTTKATDDISSKIRTIQEATQGSVQAIHSIGGMISDMSAIAQSIAAAIEEQGAATGEIARNVQLVARNMGDVAGNIATVSQSTESTRRNAGDILSAAEGLTHRSDDLRREVTAFLARVRAPRAA